MAAAEDDGCEEHNFVDLLHAWARLTTDADGQSTPTNYREGMLGQDLGPRCRSQDLRVGSGDEHERQYERTNAPL